MFEAVQRIIGNGREHELSPDPTSAMILVRSIGFSFLVASDIAFYLEETTSLLTEPVRASHV